MCRAGSAGDDEVEVWKNKSSMRTKLEDVYEIGAHLSWYVACACKASLVPLGVGSRGVDLWICIRMSVEVVDMYATSRCMILDVRNGVE